MNWMGEREGEWYGMRMGRKESLRGKGLKRKVFGSGGNGKGF